MAKRTADKTERRTSAREHGKRSKRELAAAAPPKTRGRRNKATDVEPTIAAAVGSANGSANAAAEPAPPMELRHARCPFCYTRATWDPQDSADDLRAQGFTLGFDPDVATGFPICPNCRHTMVDAHPVEAPEAVRQAIVAQNSLQPRLWADPPFNWQDAYLELERKDEAIDALQEGLDATLRQAKRQRKDVETARKERVAMRQALKQRRLQKAREVIQRTDAVAPPPDACAFTANTLQPCPVCAMPSLVLLAAACGRGRLVLQRASDAHREFAVDVNSKATPVPDLADADLVARALELGGLYGIPVEVVETWTVEERTELLAWIDAGAARMEAPPFLGVPHVAAGSTTSESSAINGDTYLCCRDCGARLASVKTGGDEQLPHYPSGALVGMGCLVEDAVDESRDAEAAHAEV